MNISVIIPAHNEEDYIETCLKSVCNQRVKNIEIIVVCDSCTDATAKLAKKYTKKVFSVKKMNVSAVRNYGLKKATGDIFCFIDADCVMSEHLLEDVINSVEKGYAGGTCRTKALDGGFKAKLFWNLGHLFDYVFLTASGFMFSCEKISFKEEVTVAEDTLFILDVKKKARMLHEQGRGNGKVAYITHSWIKTSSRRLERKGYFRTLCKQVAGFFWRKQHKYESVR